MSEPMNTAIAQYHHGHEATEEGTCSVMCSNCDQRVWFSGDMEEQERDYQCPYCNSLEFNKDLG